jgi:hypothetical protein
VEALSPPVIGVMIKKIVKGRWREEAFDEE